MPSVPPTPRSSSLQRAAARITRRCASLLRSLVLVVPFAASGTVWAQSADLVLSQHVIAPSDVFAAGTRGTITMLITNEGPDMATGVKLTDKIPAGATFVSMSTSVPGGTCALVGSDYQCSLANMAKDATATVTLVLDFPTPGHQVNTATLSAMTYDSNSFNNSSPVSATVYAAPDLRIAASSIASGQTVAGAAIDYTLKVDNPGSDIVPIGSHPTVTFNVPAGATITDVPTGTGWTCTPAAGSYPISSSSSASTTISCTRNDELAVGAAYPDIHVPAVGNVNGTVTANFGVSAAPNEANNRDNTATVDVVVVDGTDMGIEKTVSPKNTTVVPGATIVFTLQAKQYGGVAPDNVTIFDTLPAGLTYVADSLVAQSPWQCEVANNTLSCIYPGKYTGGAFTNLPAVKFSATVDAGVSGALTNKGSVSADQNDPDGSNDSSQASVSTSNSADQQITKTASVTTATLNTPYTYKLVARNLGPVDVQSGQLITVTDEIPQNMSLTAMPYGAGWSCNLVPQPAGTITYPLAGPVNVACTRSDGIGTPANWALITVPVLNTALGPTSNTACVVLNSTGAQPTDTNAANDCQTVGVTVNPVNTGKADLSIVKAVDKTDAKAGEYKTYTITVTNLGPDESTNVVITDNVLDLSYVANSLRNVKGTSPEGAAVCTPTGGKYMNVDVTCTFAKLKKGDQAVMTLEVLPSQATATTKIRTNKATVKSKDVEDPVSSNDSMTITGTVTPLVDVTAGKTVAPDSVHVGVPISYVISALNRGPSIASNVKLVDEMPANTSFLELTSVSGGGDCKKPEVGATSGTIECTWDQLGVNIQQTAEYKLLPGKGAVNTTITNTVMASTTTAESNTNNNKASISSEVMPAELDISVAKTDLTDPVKLGELTEYVVSITNAGPSIGTNLVMTDVFPNAKASARFSYQGGLTTSEPAISCSEPAVGATSGTLTCTFASIKVVERDGNDVKNVITVRYKMKAESIVTAGDYSGTQGNDVNVKVDETETIMTNNKATEDTTTRREAVVTDLALSKQVDKAEMKAGETATYTLTVTNNGPSESSGAQIIDTLPKGMTFASSSDGCVDSSGTVTCSVGTLAKDATKAFHITVTLASPYTGTSPIVNTASVDAPGDTNPDNNKGTATTKVTPDPLVTPEPKPTPVPVPTLSEIGMLLMLVLVGMVGATQLRRRR